jgi:hypothetical protein
MLFEDLADHAFPERNRAVRPEKSTEQNAILQWGAMLLYAGMFMVVSSPFFGLGAAVVMVLAFDVIPWMLSFVKHLLPNSKFLYKWYPGTASPQLGLVLTCICIGLAALVASSADARNISSTMIILAIPYALAEIPSLFGREGEAFYDGWRKRLFETGCWCAFAVIALIII